MSGIHKIEVIYEDGTVRYLECGCEWCDVWRAVSPRIGPVLDAWLRDLEPEVRPEWLGPKPDGGSP